MQQFALIISTLYIYCYVAHAFPERWPVDDQNTQNVSKTKYLSLIRTTPPTTEDGKIIFPSDEPFVNPIPMTFTPTTVSSCRNSTFCEDAPFYPEEYVKNAIRLNSHLRVLSTVDGSNAIDHRIHSESVDYETLCISQETVVFPKSAENKDKQWLFVINEDEFPQGVRIERCVEDSAACKIIDGFAAGYKTTCQQKYIYRQLAAINNDGTVGADLFRFPSSCCCHIKFIGNPLSRIGLAYDTLDASSFKQSAEKNHEKTEQKE